MISIVTNAAGAWWFRALFTLAVMAFIQPWFSTKLYFTGDEPHYLMSTVSFLKDGDFNLRNNYQLEHFHEFGYKDALKPQWGKTLNDELIPAEHGTSYPLLIAPAYAAGGEMGVRWFQIALAFAGCLLAGAVVDKLTGNRLQGSLATVLLAISPTWEMQASRLYPDIFVGVSAMLIIFFLARQSATPLRRPPFYEPFLTGLLLALMPVLYVKYGVLALPLIMTALWLPCFRTSPWLYVGAAVGVSAGAANLILYGHQGALGGNFASTASHLFTLAGGFSRYWMNWFDRHHGIFIYQPYILLSVWAVVSLLRWPTTDREKVITGLALTAVTFTGMHAAWNASPGYSVPGRYLSSIMPILCVLIAIWAQTEDSLRPVRLALIGLLSVIAVAFLILPIYERVQPDYVLRKIWIERFPQYWLSWQTGPFFTGLDQPGLEGYYVSFLVLGTKSGALLWNERRKAIALRAGLVSELQE